MPDKNVRTVNVNVPDNADPLQSSISRASRSGSPDQYLETLNLSESQQLPRDTVERNLPEVRRREWENKNSPAELRTVAPSLSEFLEDPDNAALAQDDIEKLSTLEQRLREPNALKRRAEDLERGLLAGIQATNTITGSQQGEYLSILKGINENGFDRQEWLKENRGKVHPDTIAMVVDDYETFAALSPEERQARIGEVDRALQGTIYRNIVAGDMMEERPVSSARMGFDQAEGFWGGVKAIGAAPFEVLPSLATESFGQFLPAIPFMAIPGGQLAGGSMVSYLNEYGGDLQNSMMEMGIDTKDVEAVKAVFTDLDKMEELKEHANRRSIPIAMLDGLSAGVAGKLTAAARTGRGRLAAVGTEMFVMEPGMGGLGEIGGAVNAGDDIEWKGVLAEMVAGFGSPQAAVEVYSGYRDAKLLSVENRVMKEMNNVMESMGEQERLDDAIQMAEESKLSQRAQDRFRKFLDGIPDNNTIYVDKDVVADMIEEGVQLPSSIDMNTPNLDVAIPMSQFMTEIATNEEVLARFRPHIRVNENHKSQADLQAGRDQTLESLIEKAGNDQDIRTEIDEIFDTVRDQIIATGRQSESTARYSAQVMSQYAATKAEILGVSPMEIYNKMNTRIEGPQSQVIDAGNTLFDPEIDRSEIMRRLEMDRGRQDEQAEDRGVGELEEGSTFDFYLPDGTTESLKVVAISENGGVIVENGAGEEVIVGDQYQLQNPKSPEFVLESLSEQSSVGSLSDSELNSYAERLKEKIEVKKEAGQSEGALSFVTELNAIKFEQERRANPRTERRQDAARRESIANMSPEDQYKMIYQNELTGINNRRAFEQDIGDAKNIYSLDVDALKSINDNLGQDSGDQLLQVVARVLHETTAGQVYHISGDEFYVLGDDQQALEAALKQAQEQLAGESIESNKGTIQGLGFSFGKGDTKNDADSAMKQDKKDREARGERVGRGELPLGMTLNQSKVDFGDSVYTREVEVEETGETVTMTTPSERAYEQLNKRKEVMERLKECMRG